MSWKIQNEYRERGISKVGGSPCWRFVVGPACTCPQLEVGIHLRVLQKLVLD